MPRRVALEGGQRGHFLSLASDMVVVMAFLFGHGDGEKASVKDPGVGDASAKAAPISRYGGLTQGLYAIFIFNNGCGVSVSFSSGPSVVGLVLLVSFLCYL
jgi:hypothetical protein